ncbi:hypothetical protein BDR04DRAFT_1108168 [Suillus decipiens]|nr:hypothetical protein BDR04DRAFT_1108168 [Suillus decipiens]
MQVPASSHCFDNVNWRVVGYVPTINALLWLQCVLIVSTGGASTISSIMLVTVVIDGGIICPQLIV